MSAKNGAQGRDSAPWHSVLGLVDRIATVPVLTVLLLLSALFPVILFPGAGIGDELPLDLYLSYSPDQVYAYLDRLGAGGRIAYARMEMTTDLLFPLVYSSALTVALVMTARSLLPADSRLRYLCLFPLLIVIADWGENLSLVAVIRAFPDRLDALATVASTFTSLKWLFLGVTVMMLFLAGILLLTRDRYRG